MAGSNVIRVRMRDPEKRMPFVFPTDAHHQSNPTQGLVVTGHADRSGDVRANRKLSEARARNVSLLLRGKRDDWRHQAAKTDAVDDYQTLFKWQHQRAGWDCDPGPIDNNLGPLTRTAITSFQARYNETVEAASANGEDSPFKTKIEEDGKVGPEVWGAFYDLYMSELMLLLELDKYSDLKSRQAKPKAPTGMPDVLHLFRLLIGLGDGPITGAAAFQPMADQLRPQKLLVTAEYA